jgi:hypothetical protein
MYVCVCVCMYIYVCVCVCVCMYVCIDTNNSKECAASIFMGRKTEQAVSHEMLVPN